MVLYETIPLIKNVFHITYIQNYGAAFSILQGKQVFLICISVAALGGAAFYLFRVSPVKPFPLAADCLCYGGKLLYLFRGHYCNNAFQLVTASGALRYAMVAVIKLLRYGFVLRGAVVL